MLSNFILAYTSYLNLSEAEYILCRKLGHNLSRSKVENLLRSNYITLIDTERLYALAAEIKCKRALALADCYSLATAKVTRSKALFVFMEEELTKEIHREPFDIEIRFLEDTAQNQARAK